METNLLDQFKEIVAHFSSAGEFIAVVDIKESKEDISKVKRIFREHEAKMKEFKGLIEDKRIALDKKRMK